jgi:hypothetical protein
VARLFARFGAPPSHDAEPPKPRTSAPAAEPGSLDGDQLASFAAYLERLDQWLAACDARLPEDEGTETAAHLRRCLAAIQSAVSVLGRDQTAPAVDAPARSAAPEPPEHAARGATRSPVVDDVYDGAPRREAAASAAAPGPARQIALTTGDVDPMFRWVGAENVELTAKARGQIEELFAEQGISYFRYQLENFVDEIRRRIRSAPEGHVLLIKVRNIGGERKPFLSYVTESSLAREDQPQSEA